MKTYAGIGSRDLVWEGVDQAPIIVEKMTPYMEVLREFMLYSGGASGADVLFEMLHYPGEVKIFLPYKGFNKSKSKYYNITQEAKDLAKHYHPAPQYLNDNNINFLARDCYQVLGYDLKSPIDFIICWTPNELQGGTSQALRIAKDYDIPYFNLFHDDAHIKLGKYLENVL